ncbi:MAG: hypothetical protein ABFR63_01670 [Thermodesulfobacteriota bacterium]
MAKIEDINRQQQADRRTALLALNADERRIEDDCLTDDGLACLVEHQCPAEEQKQYLSHLASCENCYRRWLELSKLAQAETTQKEQKNVHKLIQPKQLAWAGSLLAAAASVVLFLNITGEMAPPVVQQRMETGTTREKATSPEVQSTADQSIPPSLSLEKSEKVETKIDVFETEMEMPGTPPLPAPVEETTGSSQFSPPQTQQKQQPAPAKKALRAEPPMVETLPEEAAMVSADSVSLSASEWLDHIQQGCRRGEGDSQFWQKAYLEGKSLNPGQMAEKDLVDDLLPLIQELQQVPEAGPAICRQILRRLDSNTH